MGCFDMRPSLAGLVFSILVASIVAGCAPVGANYARPEMRSPSEFRFVQEPAQAQSLADLPWWEVFDDVALQTLVWEAVSNNLDVRVAAARVEEARARAGIAKSFLYPQVDGTASYGLRVS
ncbi:MAG: hypothetical protein DMF93_23000, partial [Acidobacteria bacterium]